MFWMVDETGKVIGWASDTDTRDRMIEDDPNLFALEEEEDDCLTQGTVAVIDGATDDEWFAVSVLDNKFLVEHVTDDTRTTKTVVDTWTEALNAAN